MVPAASPTASPATASAPQDSPRLPSSSPAPPWFLALSTTATAASRKKIPTMSLRASPAWSASAGTLSATAPRISDHGATQ